mmetsp:Transcript_15470/g.48075  ORF Transcript_15470/g.48075 Transcript_15470/m.48075 type:complete len:410 (-) Transcript_15470:63-1292(-)
MATILHSIGETKPHAPLSSGQTVAVFQQLHGEILKLMQKMDAQHKELEQKGNGLTKLMGDISITNSGLQDLREDFKVLGERMNVLEREAGDGNSTSEKMKAGMKAAREEIKLLREGQVKTNSNADTLRSDLKLKTDEIKSLRADIDEVLKAAVLNLQEKTNALKQDLRALTGDHEKTKKETSLQKSRLQSLGEEVKAVRSSVQTLDSTVSEQGTTLVDTRNEMQATKTNLEITNAVIYKMNETREASMTDSTDLKEGVKQANDRIDSLLADHAIVARDLAKARQEVANAQTFAFEARQEMAKTSDQISALRQGHEKTHQHVGKLTNDLAKVKNLADSTKQHLDVTNSMVLPNLGSGDMSSPGFQSGVEGTRSLGGTAGFTTGHKSARGRRETAWVARNIGLVPDRMSWI